MSGLSCPLPIVKTSKAIKEIEVGQILRNDATDPGAPPDMEAWCRQTGNEMVQWYRGDNIFLQSFGRPDLGGQGESWAPLVDESIFNIAVGLWQTHETDR